MKIHIKIIIPLLSLLPLSVSYSATPEQCYSYFTELVRSSNYPFNDWGVKPRKVNLIIDEDDSEIVRAKLEVDTDGTGTIGWIVFDKSNGELLNTTIDPEKPIKLTYNREYEKAQKYCLLGDVVYRVRSKERVYFFDKKDSDMRQTKTFIINGDYVHLLGIEGEYSKVSYQTKSGRTITGWVESTLLSQIDFKNTW